MSRDIYDEYGELLAACREDWRMAKQANVFSDALARLRAGGVAKDLGLDRAAIRAAGGGGDALNAVNTRFKDLAQEGVDEALARQYAVREMNANSVRGGHAGDLDIVRNARRDADPELARMQAEIDAQRKAYAAQAARQQQAEAAQASRAATGAPAGSVANAGDSGGGGIGAGKALGLAGAGAGLAGAGAYQYGKAEEKQRGDRNRNLAFGAGAASGAVAPQLMGNIKKLIGNQLNPNGGQ